MAADAEGMNFGPQWLRQLSDGNSLSSPPPTTTFCGFMSKHKPPKYNYNREEMLQMCRPKQDPPKYMKNYPEILSETVQKPWCGTKITPSEQRSLTQGVNSYTMLRRRGDGRMGPDSSRGRGKNRYVEPHQQGELVDEIDEKDPEFSSRGRGGSGSRGGHDNGWRTAYRSRPCHSSESGGSGGLSNEGEEDPEMNQAEFDHSGWRASGGRYFYSSRERTPSESDADWRRRDKPVEESKGTVKHPSNWRQRSTSSGTQDPRSQTSRGFHHQGNRQFRRNSGEPNDNGEVPEWSLSDVEIQATGCFDASGTFISTENDEELGDLLPDDWEKDFDEENSFSSDVMNDHHLLSTDNATIPNKMEESPRMETMAMHSLADSGLDGCDSGNKSTLDHSEPELGPNLTGKRLGVNEEDLARAVDHLFQDSRGVRMALFSQHSTNNASQQAKANESSLIDCPPTAAPHIINQWYYLDPKNQTQGPFTDAQMFEWYKSGYFNQNLMIKRHFDQKFSPLAAYLQHYKNRLFTPVDADRDNSPLSFATPHLPSDPLSFATPRNIPLPSLGRSLSDGNSIDLSMAASRLNLSDGGAVDMSGSRHDSLSQHLIGGLTTSTPSDTGNNSLAALTLLLAQRQQQQQQQQQQQYIQQQLLQLMQQPGSLSSTLTQNPLALNAYLSMQQAALLTAHQQSSATSPISSFFPPGGSSNNKTASLSDLPQNVFPITQTNQMIESLSQPLADSFYSNFSPPNTTTSLNQAFSNSSVTENSINKFGSISSAPNKSDNQSMNFDESPSRQPQKHLAPGASYQSWIPPTSETREEILSQTDTIQYKFSAFDQNSKKAWSLDPTAAIKVANNGDGHINEASISLLPFLSGENTLECSQLERELFAQNHPSPNEGNHQQDTSSSIRHNNNSEQQIKSAENSEWRRAVTKPEHKSTGQKRNADTMQKYSNAACSVPNLQGSHYQSASTTANIDNQSVWSSATTGRQESHQSMSTKHSNTAADNSTSSFNHTATVRPQNHRQMKQSSNNSKYKENYNEDDMKIKSNSITSSGDGMDGRSNAVKELKEWFLLELEGMNYSQHVDINTLVELLFEIESPFEVEDILQDNLGSSVRIPQLTKHFLEKRLVYRQKASHLPNSTKSHPHTSSNASNSNEQWFVAANSGTGRRKSKKKKSPNTAN